MVKETDFQFYFNISPVFSNVKLGYTLIYSVAALRSALHKEAGYFGTKSFSHPGFCFAWLLLSRRGGKIWKTVRTGKDKRFSLLFIFLWGNQKEEGFSMNDKYQTVSVRLSWGEYRALQAQAQAEYTSMSGVLRRLLNGYLKGAANDGQANG